MQMQTGIRALNERLDNSQSWMAEQEALRDEWSAETAGVTLPALVNFTDSLATVRRELDAAVEDVEALERWSAAIEALGDAAGTGTLHEAVQRGPGRPGAAPQL